MISRRFLYLFLGVLTVLRLVYCGQVELSPDEAYYFQWSEHLAPSYFSKGPGIALTMWLSTHLFGVSEFGIRAFSPLLGLGTSLLIAWLARRLYSESVAVWAVVLINCTPIFNVGSLLLTIDPLSIFFWAAALATFWRALEESPAFSRWWPLTGALIGCGFLAKYTNAMQLLSILLLLALTPKYRRELWRPGFASLLAVFALCTIPVFVWNAQHDWITLRHLGERGGLNGGPRFRPGEFFTYLGLHFGVYSPLIFGGLLFALPWAWKKARIHFKPRFLLAFTLPLFVLYFTLALKQSGEPNWTAPAAISLAILAVACWHELAEERKWARPFAIAALALGAGSSFITVDFDILRRVGIPLSYDRDPSARLRGWRSGAEQIEALRKKYEAEQGRPVFLIANNYGTASSLAFYLRDKRREGPGHPPVYCPMSAVPGNQFYFWPRYDGTTLYADTARTLLPTLDTAPRAKLATALAGLEVTGTPEEEMRRRRIFLMALNDAAPQLAIDENFTEAMGYSSFLGRSALYITDRPEGKPDSTLIREFAHWEKIADIAITRRGLPLRQLRVFACTDYRQPEL
ncbi:MAG: glycosyltransferase family 39 protein [Chthoniobacter sp.]|nr:glycosyltransferase family 39 protein [Chthoniobacter sp.]